MRFLITESSSQLAGQLVYRVADQAFDYVLSDVKSNGFTSLLINDINLEVSEKGFCLYAWGYCPQSRWINGDVSAPTFAIGSLQIDEQCIGELEPGISLRLTSVNAWAVTIDEKAGWMRVGTDDESTDIKRVQFANGQIAALKAGKIVALYLQVEKR